MRFAQAPLGLRQGQRQQKQARQLRGEGLGGRDTHFHAGACEVGQLAFAHHRRRRHVADGEGVAHAQGLRVAQGRQRVSGLARLGDGDHQRVRIGHGFAIAVFAGDLHLRGDLGNGLEPVLGRAAAVVAGAAGQDQDRIDLLEHAVRAVARRRLARTLEQLGHDGLQALERVGDRARLLEDFLLHVVAIRPEFGRAAMGLHRAHGAIGGPA